MDAGNVGTGAAEDVDEDEATGVEEDKGPVDARVITGAVVRVEDAAAGGWREYVLVCVCVCVGMEPVDVALSGVTRRRLHLAPPVPARLVRRSLGLEGSEDACIPCQDKRRSRANPCP